MDLIHSSARESLIQNQPPARETLSCSLLKEGIPRGAITEISGFAGSGKSELVLRLLAENPTLRAAWIEDQLTAYPCAFPQRGVGLERILFTEAGGESLWATQQILRSQLFDVLVLHTAQHLDEVNLRRAQISAKQNQVALILLSEKPTTAGSWPITLQLQVLRHPFQIKTLKSTNRTLWTAR